MAKTSSHENDLKIWSHYIEAQSSLISKLCTPIHLLPIEGEINSKGIIKIEINQKVNDNAILELIQKYFPNIQNEDVLLENGYFLLDNDNIPAQKQITDFQNEVANFYIDFDTHPTIEGVLSDLDAPINELTELLENNQTDVQFNIDGELLLTLNGIDLFDRQKRIKREQKIGAIYHVKIARYKSITDSVKGLFDRLSIDKSDYKIIPHECKIYTSEAIFTKDGFQKLNNVIGLKMVTWIVKIWVNQADFKGDWNKSHLKEVIQFDANGNSFYEFHPSKIELIFEKEVVSFEEFYALSYCSLMRYYGKNGITKIEKMYIFEYDSDSSYFDEINSLELDDEAWEKIKERLDLSVFWCNTLKNIISFDFVNRNDFIQKYEQLDAIKWLDLSGYKDEHKFKITPIIPDRFENVKKQLSARFPKIRFKDENGGQKLTIRYGYKLSEDESDARLRFLNAVNEYKNEGFSFALDTQFKVKFIFEVNEQLKKFEENTKFSKIKGEDIMFGKAVIGKLKKANFPILELQINSDFIAKLNENLSENNAYLSHIEPVLLGELEKIKRLDDTIKKLNTSGDGLPNPNIVNFIFDSSKAKANENAAIFDESSPEWQDLERTKLSQNINKSQLKAVLTTLQSKDLAIVQGPPGTGKSTAISEILWQHIRTNPKQKILLTSETHLAVDNALDKLATPHNNLVKPIRFGKEDSLEEEGARFSLTRIQNWVDGTYSDPSVSNNGVSKWIENISDKSGEYEGQENIDELICVWRGLLNKPNPNIKTLFKNTYLDNANVIGATCSSISERTSEGKLSSFIRSYCNVFHRKDFEEIQSKKANKSTYDSINKVKVNFDVVIMDEASKATPAEFALPLVFGKKSIVVGDHRQLPPMLDENDFVTTLEMIGQRQLARQFQNQDHNISHFEKLFLNPNISKTIKASFDTQYRMHPQINDVIKQFYVADGGLVCGLDPLQVDDPNLNNPVSRYHGFSLDGFVDPQTHVIWVNVDTPEVLEGTSRVNFGEIEACRNILHCLKNATGFDEFQNHWQNNPKAKPEETEIGLISFYGRQLYYLDKVKEEFKNEITIRSNTVDKFQGMERNIIIVSMVRSDKIAGSKNQEPDFEIYPELGYSKQQSLGFAEFPNRLNVALSRAKRLLIIVGNATHFCKHDVYKNVYETIKQSSSDKIIDFKTLPKFTS